MGGKKNNNKEKKEKRWEKKTWEGNVYKIWGENLIVMPIAFGI